MKAVTVGLIVVMVMVLALVAVNYVMNEIALDKEQTYCYDDRELITHKASDVTIVEIQNYSCEVIDYAISNSLKLISVNTLSQKINYKSCFKVYNREFINQTEVSRNNFTDYQYHIVSKLGDYYMANCLDNALSTDKVVEDKS